MGIVHAEIILRNAADVSNVNRGYIKEPEIRQTTVTAIVDTGSVNLVINEDIRRQLGLSLERPYKARLADGSLQTYNFAESVQIQWKDRIVTCQAVVVQEGNLRLTTSKWSGSVEVPNANNVLLGAIPLEALDLIVNPVNQELIGAHGDEIVYTLY